MQNAVAAIAALAGLVLAAPAHIGADPIYAGPGNQAGYQATDTSGFRAAGTTFIVPDAAATGQAGLTGIDLTDTAAGRMAGCGWLGSTAPNGTIGCFDEAAAGPGFTTLLPTVSPGDSVTVTMTWNSGGQMKVTAFDQATRASGKATFDGAPGEKWTEALIGAVPSATTPAAPITLTAFSRTRLTPACGRPALLLRAVRCALHRVLVTSNGQRSGQLMAEPTTLRHNDFRVLQQP